LGDFKKKIKLSEGFKSRFVVAQGSIKGGGIADHLGWWGGGGGGGLKLGGGGRDSNSSHVQRFNGGFHIADFRGSPEMAEGVAVRKGNLAWHLQNLAGGLGIKKSK